MIRFHRAAEDDIISIWQWYEDEYPGLGNRFKRALDRTFDLIETHPRLYGVVKQRIRAAPLRRFPYVVYYRIEGPVERVIAVIHKSRSKRT